MKLMRWLDADELGHPIIDREHRDIVDALNEAIHAFNNRRNEACAVAIARAVDVTRRHFSHEEAVLLDVGCSDGDVDRHAAYHRRLLAEAEKIAALCGKDQRREFLEPRLAELIHFVTHEIRAYDGALKHRSFSQKAVAEIGR